MSRARRRAPAGRPTTATDRTGHAADAHRTAAQMSTRSGADERWLRASPQASWAQRCGVGCRGGAQPEAAGERETIRTLRNMAKLRKRAASVASRRSGVAGSGPVEPVAARRPSNRPASTTGR